MTVRLYTSLDTGAPVLSGTQFARVRQILLACLVNGYGSKPAAGWTVGHDVTGGFSLFNGFGYVNFVEGSTAYVHSAYIMEAITDGTTALAGGVNRRSAGWYDGASASEKQSFFTGSTGLNSTSNPYWSVIADDKTCILFFGGGTGTANSSGGAQAVHYFGQYINASGLTGAAAFCSLGGFYNDGNNAPLFFSYSSRYGCCLRNPFTGLVAQGDGARYGASGAIHVRGTAGLVATKTQLSRLQSVRAVLAAYGGNLGIGTAATSSAVIGYLRGVVSEPTLCVVPLSQTMTLMGLSNIWQNRVTALNLPNGQKWLPLFGTPADLAGFASLDPADWE